MFITTGNFTKAAIEEANRDGAALLILWMATSFADKLKEQRIKHSSWYKMVRFSPVDACRKGCQLSRVGFKS